MSLSDARRAIRPLLNERQPADAMAAYYAFYHPAGKTQLHLYPPQAQRAQGYLALARTGIDLFRPLLTLRLPPDDHAAVEMLHQTLAPGTTVILHSSQADLPLLKALFDVQTEEHLHLYRLDPARFEPIINVLVTQSQGPNGLPRFAIRRTQQDNEVVAAAGLNWQTDFFGDITVYTAANSRRQGWGRSVVAAMAHYLLENGRVPLYAVAGQNIASMQLAEHVGFVDSGVRQVIMQATLKPRLFMP